MEDRDRRRRGACRGAGGQHVARRWRNEAGDGDRAGRADPAPAGWRDAGSRKGPAPGLADRPASLLLLLDRLVAADDPVPRPRPSGSRFGLAWFRRLRNASFRLLDRGPGAVRGRSSEAAGRASGGRRLALAGGDRRCVNRATGVGHWLGGPVGTAHTEVAGDYVGRLVIVDQAPDERFAKAIDL